MFKNVIPIAISTKFELHHESHKEMRKLINAPKLCKLFGYYLSLMYTEKDNIYSVYAKFSYDNYAE